MFNKIKQISNVKRLTKIRLIHPDVNRDVENDRYSV